MAEMLMVVTCHVQDSVQLGPEEVFCYLKFISMDQVPTSTFTLCGDVKSGVFLENSNLDQNCTQNTGTLYHLCF